MRPSSPRERKVPPGKPCAADEQSARAASNVFVIGSLLATLGALAFLGLGAGAATVPQVVAEGYGIPATTGSTQAYVRAVGARDAALGLLILWFLLGRERKALRAVLAVSAFVGASDFAIVLAARKPAARLNLVIHATGTLGLLAARRLLGPEP